MSPRCHLNEGGHGPLDFAQNQNNINILESIILRYYDQGKDGHTSEPNWFHVP